MTLSFSFFLALLLLQVLTLYFVVCLTCDLHRHDSRLAGLGDTVDGLKHRVHMLQDGAEMAVRRLDDVTQAVKDMDGGLEAMANRLGRETEPVVPGVPDSMQPVSIGEVLKAVEDGINAHMGNVSPSPKIELDIAENGPSYFAPGSQYPGTTPHVTFAEGGGHD